nr:hypothetical protein GCM10023233_25660 [Brevibacterium otitidis]
MRLAGDEATPAEDRFGRRLAYVEAGGKDLGAELLKAGLAEVYEAEDDIARFDQYRELRAAAPLPPCAQ